MSLRFTRLIEDQSEPINSFFSLFSSFSLCFAVFLLARLLW
jgi:hypothetical protein